ncbi:MAG: DUF2812 domain-containing protein [Defluviitaleaceae bacterium]|nr:DUF2812 domain-containing protein [Defluviitaleaceae bacterium]
MKKHRYKIGDGLYHSEGKDLKMLEDMAAQGYTLIKASRWGYYKFRAAKSEECAYSLDIADITHNAEEFNEYKEIFNAGGWEYVTGLDEYHFFKAPKGTMPIYSDTASMVYKYEKMWKSCLWLIVPFGMLTIASVVLYVIFKQFYMLGIVGGALGGCLSMSHALLINRKRVARLRQGVGIDELEAESAEKYERLSKARGRGFLWGMLAMMVIAAIIVVLKVLNIVPNNAIGTVVGGSIWGIFVFISIHVLYMGYCFFAYRNKAVKMRG